MSATQLHYKPVTLVNNVSEVWVRMLTGSRVCVCVCAKIFQRDGTVVCLDSSSEEDCNWMMLVRPAGDHAHQNLSAYQQDDDVYFNTSQVASPPPPLQVLKPAVSCRDALVELIT